jgi:hypothetical protein
MGAITLLALALYPRRAALWRLAIGLRADRREPHVPDAPDGVIAERPRA